MHTRTFGPRSGQPRRGASEVRILLAADAAAARLTLHAVLSESGYAVDCAVSPAEAMEKLETQQYDLVLCDFRDDGEDSNADLLRFAQAQEYRPAAARLRVSPEDEAADLTLMDEVLVGTMDVPALLTAIADRLAGRAYGRSLRQARRIGLASA